MQIECGEKIPADSTEGALPACSWWEWGWLLPSSSRPHRPLSTLQVSLAPNNHWKILSRSKWLSGGSLRFTIAMKVYVVSNWLTDRLDTVCTAVIVSMMMARCDAVDCYSCVSTNYVKGDDTCLENSLNEDDAPLLTNCDCCRVRTDQITWNN